MKSSRVVRDGKVCYLIEMDVVEAGAVMTCCAGDVLTEGEMLATSATRNTKQLLEITKRARNRIKETLSGNPFMLAMREPLLDLTEQFNLLRCANNEQQQKDSSEKGKKQDDEGTDKA